MQTKLIAAMVGAFGYGALVGWAFTADHMDQKRLAEVRLLRKHMNTANEEFYARNTVSGDFDIELYREWARTNGTVETLKEGMNPSEIYRQTKGLITSSEVDLTPIRGDEPAEVRIIKNADFHDISLDLQPGPGGGEIISVSPIEEGDSPSAGVDTESDPENSPGEDADEDDEIYEAGVPEGETPDETRQNLQRLIDQYTADPEEAVAFIQQAVNTVKLESAPDYTPPFVISQAKYAWDEEEGDDYAKITLLYFPRERILLDDDEELIEGTEVDTYVGWRNLQRFGDQSGDADVVFIRNRRLATDFEVVKDDVNPPPIHVRYGMTKETYRANKAAGHIRNRDEDG